MRHQAVLARLHLSIGVFLETRPRLGRAYFAPFDVVFSRWDVVEPDLLVIAGDQFDVLTAKNVQGAPARDHVPRRSVYLTAASSRSAST